MTYIVMAFLFYGWILKVIAEFGTRRIMDLSVSIREAHVVVLDYESTGSLRGFANEPWQIGMVTLSSGSVDRDSMFESFLRIDINRPFNPHAPGRHGELREKLAVAPTPQDLWMSIGPVLRQGPLCAHNIATEKKFLRSMAPMHRFGPWIDTLKLTRKAWPGCASYALEDLVMQFDLKSRVDSLCPGRAAHDALYDAVAAALLLSHLIQQQGWGEITVADLTAF
jgi:DNA polymerase-3 subunit epsilon